MRPVNGLLTILWVALIPISMMTGWLNSLTASRGADHDAFSATPVSSGRPYRVEARNSQVPTAQADVVRETDLHARHRERDDRNLRHRRGGS
jgi:hypothetical protein